MSVARYCARLHQLACSSIIIQTAARLLLPCRYDMKYDLKYAYFKLVEELAASIGLVALQQEQQAQESDGCDSTEEGHQPLCV
jgi:hypothetical protein